MLSKPKKRGMGLYLGIAFVWSWSLWLGAHFYGQQIGYTLDTNWIIFDLLQMNREGGEWFSQLLFALAVYGPLMGYFVVNVLKLSLKNDHDKPSPFKFKWYLLAISIPLILVIPILILSFITLKPDFSKGFIPTATSVVVYFVANLITSGTEELGWRGILYPKLKETTRDFWDLSFKGGLIWAVWHFPILWLMYRTMPLAAVAPMFVGFTAGIIAMNYISNVIYEKTKSLGLMMIFHALNNTMSFLLILFFPNQPYMIGVHLLAWLMVAILDKRLKIAQ